MKLCLALLSLVAVAHAGTLGAVVATITKSQEQCKDVYQFIVTKSVSSIASATVVITADSKAALEARMIPQGSSTWPSTLTQGTHFTFSSASSSGCGGTAVTGATATYSNGVITVSHASTNDQYVCVKLTMCTLVYVGAAAGDWVVTTSSDTTVGATVTGLDNANIGAKMGSATFVFTPTAPLAGTDNVLAVTPTYSSTDPSSGHYLTISIKGFTQKSGSVCTINSQDYDATTSDSVDKIVIVLATSKLLDSTNVISCTKVQGTAAATAVVPNGFGIAYGSSTTNVVGYFYADAPIIAAAPTPAFSSAPSTCANVLVPSLLALVAASLLV